MKNKATLLLHSFDELISCLTDEEAGRLLKAILDYDIRSKNTDFEDRSLHFLYVQIKNSLDTHKAHYEKVCTERKKSAKKRWNDEAEQKTGTAMQLHANAYNININENEKENIKTNSNANVNVSKNISSDNADGIEEPDTHTHKKAYGDFSNVYLTDEEYDYVKTKMPDGERRLQSFSAYIASSGKTYANYYARLLTWEFLGEEPRFWLKNGKDAVRKKPPGERREPTFDVEAFKKKALNPVFVPPT